jgi:hypothetical protein
LPDVPEPDVSEPDIPDHMKRFYSHGCIRIEKPLQLANLILPTPVDSSFVQSCLKDEKPMDLDLVNSVPVFVILQHSCCQYKQQCSVLQRCI